MERLAKQPQTPPVEELPRFASFEEFIAWVDEDVSAEYIEGEVAFMSPASLRHQLLAGFLHNIFTHFVEHHELGTVVTAPFKVRLNEQYGPEPDLIFVSRPNESRLKDTYFDGAPDLVVEIISPESFVRDRGNKYLAYETAGVSEYWLLDPWRGQAEFYQLDGEGYYQLQPVNNGEYRSRALLGLVLPVAWLWENPLPKIQTVLQTWGLLS